MSKRLAFGRKSFNAKDGAILVYDLAVAYLDAENFDKAAVEFEQAWEYFSRNLNRDYPEYIYSLSNFCFALEQLDDDEKTVKYLKILTKNRRKYKRRRPGDKDRLIADHIRLARAQERLGDFKEVEKTLKSIGREELGDQSFSVADEFKGDMFNFRELRRHGWFLADIKLENKDGKQTLVRKFELANDRGFRLYTHSNMDALAKIKDDPMKKNHKMHQSFKYTIDGEEKIVSLWHFDRTK